MSGMIERSSSAGSTAGPIRSTMHLTPTGSPSIGKPEASVVVPGSREMKSGNRPGMELRRVDRLEEGELLLQHGQWRGQPERREQRPDPGAVRDHAGVARDVAGVVATSTPRRPGRRR